MSVMAVQEKCDEKRQGRSSDFVSGETVATRLSPSTSSGLRQIRQAFSKIARSGARPASNFRLNPETSSVQIASGRIAHG